MRRLLTAAALAAAALTFAQTAAASIVWSGGPVNGKLVPPWSGLQEKAANRITVVPSPVNDGQPWIRFEVDPGDALTPTDPTSERAQTNGYGIKPALGTEGSEAWWAWSVYFPAGYNPQITSLPLWNIFSQFQQCQHGQANLNFEVNAATRQLVLALNNGSDPNRPNQTKLVLGGLQTPKRYDLVVDVVWSSSPSIGRLEVWMNGQVVVPLRNTATLYTSGCATSPFQQIYRQRHNETDVLYQTGMRRATDYASAITAFPAGTWPATPNGTPPPPPATPTLVFTQKPATSTTSTSATIGWTKIGATSISCWLDTVKSSCRNPVTYSNLKVGKHTFTVTAVKAGQTQTIIATWTVAPPPNAAACDKTISTGGNILTLIGTLTAGQIGCLDPGTYPGFSVSSSNGTATAPVTIRSANPAAPALIDGRVVTFPGGDNLTFTDLRFTWSTAPDGPPSVTVGSNNVTFDRDDITNAHRTICVATVDSTTYGVAHHTVVEDSRIHGCGVLPPTNGDHGLYLTAFAATVTGNWIYDNADRGVQLRGSQGATVTGNVIDSNGEGIIFGDLAASNNTVTGNVIANSQVRFNVESYWGSTPVGAGNVLSGNCLWASNSSSFYDTNGGDSLGPGYSSSGNVVGDPGYPGAGDYQLPAGSACAGYGPASSPGP